MLDTDLVKIVEGILGVDPENNGPFDPKVICHIGGGQKRAIKYSRDLSMRRNSALVCTMKFSGTFSKMIAGIDVGLAILLTRLEGLFPSKIHPGEIIQNFHFSDAVILFYNTTIDKQKEVVEEIGRRKIGSLFVLSYCHTNSLFGHESTSQSTKPPPPFLADIIARGAGADKTNWRKRAKKPGKG